MSKEYGFLYFLSNVSMPNCYKIGFSTKHPMLRAMELSSATACPTPFKVFTYFGCENPLAIENYIHKMLSKHRLSSRREFFNLDETQIHECIHEVCGYFNVDDFSLICSHADLMFLLYEKSLIDDKKWKVDYYNQQCADSSSMDFKKIGFL